MHVNYDFLQFDKARLRATEAAWLDDAEQEYAFPGTVEAHMTWLENHTEHVEGEGVAYGVFPPEGGAVAVATCKCIFRGYAKSTQWVKFISMTLRPELENRLDGGEVHALRVAIDAYRAAVFGVMRLMSEQKAPIMKIYGRSHDQLRLLQQLAVDLDDNEDFSEHHTSKIEGRWLVIGPRC
ncbi:hypothetical protein [Sphaerotilus uruguayifluvii]|uniref:Uncharacterized protein n=1 Tax=Sphaerotilus uruguayifluvii TaxID=2735897 RepID=A0ABX2FYZ0_9BURK|nr:hypothetical protein [Leptothrix sp. C29]NRT55187.1 hypothetical protein [Leptothrix sp. C29]